MTQICQFCVRVRAPGVHALMRKTFQETYDARQCVSEAMTPLKTDKRSFYLSGK